MSWAFASSRMVGSGIAPTCGSSCAVGCCLSSRSARCVGSGSGAGFRKLYFAHDDNRTSGEVIYRLRVQELTLDRLVVTTENVSPVRKLMLRLAEPGGLQSVHFLERKTPHVWRYYVLARTAEDFTFLLGVTDRSYVNRAVALYRHFIGIPTDRDLPLAP